MLNKVKHLYTDSSLTLRMTGSVNMYIIPKNKVMDIRYFTENFKKGIEGHEHFPFTSV